MELVRNGENLHQLKSLSLKGGTRLFGGGDPKCVSWKGTASYLKSRVTWGGHLKGLVETS